jgi:hypothetical protein
MPPAVMLAGARYLVPRPSVFEERLDVVEADA